ncbi:MAG: DUF6569 family protein [Bacillota bacterium]
MSKRLFMFNARRLPYTVRGQAGVGVYVNGRFSCLDLFASPVLLRKAWAKLLRSYAMEAIDTASDESPKAGVEFGKILSRLREMECRSYPSVGKGTDIRVRGKNLIGAGLVDEGHLIHLGVFYAEAVAKGGMAGTSRRRSVCGL